MPIDAHQEVCGEKQDCQLLYKNHILWDFEILMIRYGDKLDHKNQQQTEVWVYSVTVIYINILQVRSDFVQSFIPVDWSTAEGKEIYVFF